MTRKNKKYQLLISTLLLCFLQMAGIDVYAQAPVTPVQKDTTITHREPPKARARSIGLLFLCRKLDYLIC